MNQFDKNFPDRKTEPEQVLRWYHSGKTGPDPLGPRPPDHNWWFDYEKGKWTLTRKSDAWYVSD